MKQDKITLPAKLGHLEAMLNFITDRARLQGFDDKRINHIQLSAEEVLVNIINYAYPDTEGEIEIAVTPLAQGGLEVTITDSGRAFDPLVMPDPDIKAPLEQRKIGGLGIYLLRRLMDQVTYKRQDNRNILTFIKKK